MPCRLATRARAPAARSALRQLGVIVLDRPMQRRRSVRVGGVRIGALRQQRSRGARVAGLRRVQQRPRLPNERHA